MSDPTQFAAMVGHALVAGRLRRALVEQRLGGAYLFVGESGIGKRTLATIWARSMQCLDPVGTATDLEACGRCRSCRQHDASSHPDLFVLEPQDSSVITIHQVRSLQGELAYRPLTSTRRVVLVPRAERLNLEASNGLLKTLEEPPDYVVFVLVTSQRDRLLPTILSRCSLIRCTAPPPELIIAHLTRTLGLTDERARRVLAAVQGRVGPAIQSALDDAPDIVSFDDLGEPAVIASPPKVLAVAERVAKNQESLRVLLTWLTLWLRDVLAWQATHDDARLLNSHRAHDVAWWAGRLSVDEVLETGAALHTLWTALNRNLNPQLSAEVALLNICLRVRPQNNPKGSRR